MININLFPNAQEITESMAIYRCLEKHLTEISFKDENIFCNFILYFHFWIFELNNILCAFRLSVTAAETKNVSMSGIENCIDQKLGFQYPQNYQKKKE